MSEININFCPFDGYRFLGEEDKCNFCGFDRFFADKNWGSLTNSPINRRERWRKLLWIKQDYPDNYVDGTFLGELEKNVNVRAYDYWTVLKESCAISQHISSIVIFIAIFIYLYNDMLSAQNLIIIETVTTIIGYFFWDISISKTDPSYEYKRWKTAKGAVLFFVTLLCLSPILKTLTIDTSSDTIWALTVMLFLANMLLHDYGSENRTNIKFPGSLSTNAAMFASVLLASRLTSNSHVFGLMSFAIEWFALFPIFRRYIKSLSDNFNMGLTGLLFMLATILFLNISKVIVFFYILGIAFITFVCPFWLIWIQRYKNEIHGPWDEARPKITTY